MRAVVEVDESADVGDKLGVAGPERLHQVERLVDARRDAAARDQVAVIDDACFPIGMQHPSAGRCELVYETGMRRHRAPARESGADDAERAGADTDQLRTARMLTA